MLPEAKEANMKPVEAIPSSPKVQVQMPKEIKEILDLIPEQKKKRGRPPRVPHIVDLPLQGA